ncbi:MAG: sugar phosphate isomerase/epimerase [Pirellulaceae bacterium]|nr:sugar phosphate isomerase/epimerase [Pirellulaceae bacterium]
MIKFVDPSGTLRHRMLQIKIGVQLASLRQPFTQGLHTVHELGADAVEIDARREISPDQLSQSGVRQVRKMLSDLNLRVSCLRFQTRSGYHVLDRLEKRIDATKQALKLAYDLGTNVVVNDLGRLPSDDDSGGMSTLIEALGEIGRYGQKVGATLAAQTTCESGQRLAELIRRLPPGALAIDLHPAELILNSLAPATVLRSVAPYVAHVHAADATRDVTLGRGVETPLGRGNAEFPELLAILEEHEYRGYLTIERRGSENPLADIRQAIEFLRNI